MRTENICNASSHFSYFGVSRSATIVIAYIMKKYELSFEDALERYVPVLIQCTMIGFCFLFFFGIGVREYKWLIVLQRNCDGHL